MGFLDKLLGREPLHSSSAPSRPSQRRPRQRRMPSRRPEEAPPPRTSAPSPATSTCCAPRRPEDIEKVHAEAFAKLTPEQRQMVLQRLNEDLPEGERPRSDQPADLARSATRAEMSRPGYLQGAFGGGRARHGRAWGWAA